MIESLLGALGPNGAVVEQTTCRRINKTHQTVVWRYSWRDMLQQLLLLARPSPPFWRQTRCQVGQHCAAVEGKDTPSLVSLVEGWEGVSRSVVACVVMGYR